MSASVSASITANAMPPAAQVLSYSTETYRRFAVSWRRFPAYRFTRTDQILHAADIGASVVNALGRPQLIGERVGAHLKFDDERARSRLRRRSRSAWRWGVDSLDMERRAIARGGPQ